MSMTDTARNFFEACETGKGWAECSQYCHGGATFSCQADALIDITTVEGYVDWVQGLQTPVPDGHYELKSFSADEERGVVTAFAVFKGTQSGPGPVDPPTGNTVATDYVYAMEFEGDQVRHLTKIWNDVHALKQLGWA